MSPDDITAGPITAGLHQVHVQLALLTSTIQGQRENLSRVEADLSKMIARHDKILMGNGDVGVVTRVDRLEKKDEGRSRNLWLVWGAIITGFVKFVSDAVDK